MNDAGSRGRCPVPGVPAQAISGPSPPATCRYTQRPWSKTT